MASSNYQVVFHSRPGEENKPVAENFQYEETPYPSESLKDDELLIKNLYLSLDPALRCLMNPDSGVEYIKAWEVGQTVTGLGGVGEVVASNDKDFCPGDLVMPNLKWPWKLYFVISSSMVRKIPAEITSLSPTLSLSIFGITGLTAFLGIKEKGHLRRGANQTMVVSAAAGSTGSLAGQIAKAEGCGLVIGICGTDMKCKWVTEELGFGGAINYKEDSVPDKLKELCPKGVDIYFDNVGGTISDQVIKQMNQDSHIVLCGQIAVYNKKIPYPPPVCDEITSILKKKNITRERFLVLNYQDQFEASVHRLMELYATGQVKVKETEETGLCNAGKAFVSMMEGGNIGKQLVKVSE